MVVSLADPTGPLLFLSPTITFLAIYLSDSVKLNTLQVDQNSESENPEDPEDSEDLEDPEIPQVTPVAPSPKELRVFGILAQGFLQLAIPKVPRISTLEIDSIELHVHSSTFSIFSILDSIEGLRINLPIDVHGIRALSHMRSLRSLRLQLLSIEDGSAIPFIDGFCNLTSLSVVGSLASCSHMLKIASFSSLKGFNLEVNSVNNTGNFQQGFADICTSLGPSQSLDCILLTSRRKRGSLSRVFLTPLLEVLRPFTCLNDLILDFREDSRTMVHISDEDIKTVAATWPKIVTFSVSVGCNIEFYQSTYNHPNEDRLPLPSLYALLTIARHCPELCELEIPAIALPERYVSNNDDTTPSSTSASDFMNLARASPQNDRLTRLWVYHLVGDTSHRSLLAFALLLDTLFPNLGVPYSDFEDTPGYSASISEWFGRSFPDMFKIVAMLVASVRAGREIIFPYSDNAGELVME